MNPKSLSRLVMLLWIASAGCSERLEPGTTGYRNSAGELIEIDPAEIQVRLPLYNAFIQSDAEVVEKYPNLRDYNYLGTDFEPIPKNWVNGGYWCTPINSVAFGWTGGDGVHFSFLLEGDTIDENSPVLMTIPMNSDLANIVVAANFADFLKFGLNHGYFSMEQLSYEPEEAFPILIDANWKTDETTGWKSLIATSREQRLGLDATREILELGRCELSRAEFERLQQENLPKLILPNTK